MERQFAEWGVAATRIAAFDGRGGNLRYFLNGEMPTGIAPPRLACYASHLAAIRAFLMTREERAVIMEDDCSFETVAHWPFTWSEAEALLPFHLDALQMTIINDRAVTVALHRRYMNDYSSAAYLITRRYAEKLAALYFDGDKARLDHAFNPELTSEIMLFEPGASYAMPLFSYETDFASQLRPDHAEALHEPSRKRIMQFWREEAAKLPDWRALFRVNPALGRLPPV